MTGAGRVIRGPVHPLVHDLRPCGAPSRVHSPMTAELPSPPSQSWRLESWGPSRRDSAPLPPAGTLAYSSTIRSLWSGVKVRRLVRSARGPCSVAWRSWPVFVTVAAACSHPTGVNWCSLCPGVPLGPGTEGQMGAMTRSPRLGAALGCSTRSPLPWRQRSVGLTARSCLVRPGNAAWEQPLGRNGRHRSHSEVAGEGRTGKGTGPPRCLRSARPWGSVRTSISAPTGGSPGTPTDACGNAISRIRPWRRPGIPTTRKTFSDDHSRRAEPAHVIFSRVRREGPGRDRFLRVTDHPRAPGPGLCHPDPAQSGMDHNFPARGSPHAADRAKHQLTGVRGLGAISGLEVEMVRGAWPFSGFRYLSWACGGWLRLCGQP